MNARTLMNFAAPDEVAILRDWFGVSWAESGEKEIREAILEKRGILPGDAAAKAFGLIRRRARAALEAIKARAELNPPATVAGCGARPDNEALMNSRRIVITWGRTAAQDTIRIVERGDLVAGWVIGTIEGDCR